MVIFFVVNNWRVKTLHSLVLGTSLYCYGLNVSHPQFRCCQCDVGRGGMFKMCLGHEGSCHATRTKTFIKKKSFKQFFEHFCPSTWEGTSLPLWRMPEGIILELEYSPHRQLNLLVPCSWACRAPELLENKFLLFINNLVSNTLLIQHI